MNNHRSWQSHHVVSVKLSFNLTKKQMNRELNSLRRDGITMVTNLVFLLAVVYP